MRKMNFVGLHPLWDHFAGGESSLVARWSRIITRFDSANSDAGCLLGIWEGGSEALPLVLSDSVLACAWEVDSSSGRDLRYRNHQIILGFLISLRGDRSMRSP